MRLFGLITLLFAISSYADVVQVTDDNLDVLIKSSDEWLLDFYADWCGYCKKFAPKYEAAERILASNTETSHVRVGKVNVDTAPALAARFFVQRLPTVVHIKEHEVRVIPRPKPPILSRLLQTKSGARLSLSRVSPRPLASCKSEER
ncbi:thioredoxin-like protein [Syncephalastrum racemosum]|uniref:Thioredoxin-like protein n=1 Tax=Syncephalastrum racemosum TaxID=13706 RepID=A0A1X2H9Q7_SYNRA|nr:thioredoxin-like protein [Syncephalastrum racemosum]